MQCRLWNYRMSRDNNEAGLIHAATDSKNKRKGWDDDGDVADPWEAYGLTQTIKKYRIDLLIFIEKQNHGRHN